MFMGDEMCDSMQEEAVEQEPRKQPSVIKWGGGGHTVYVSFDNGVTKIPMVKRLASLGHNQIPFFVN